MADAPDIATAWCWLLERRPGTRGATHDELLVVVEAAYVEPRLRVLYPFPTHGALHFLRSAPPWRDRSRSDDLPFILYGGPPYKVYASGYTGLLGEAATPGEAVSIMVTHLPTDVVTGSSAE